MDQLGWGKIRGIKLITVDNIDPVCEAVRMKANIGWGEPIQKYCLKNIEIKIEKGKNNGKLEDLVGNVNNVLMVNQTIKEIISSFKLACDQIEYIPFSLKSSRGKLLSDQLYIINPIGLHDFVHKELSSIRYHMDGGKLSVLAIDKLVLIEKKMANAPCIFKIEEDPSECFIDIHLARKLQAAKCENIMVEEIEVK